MGAPIFFLPYDVRMTFGKTVRRLRMKRGMTLRALARAIGTSNTYISIFERDRCNPPSDTVLKQIAKALDVEYTELRLAAGRIDPEVEEIVLRRPDLWPLLRSLKGWTEAEIYELVDVVNARKERKAAVTDPPPAIQ